MDLIQNTNVYLLYIAYKHYGFFLRIRLNIRPEKRHVRWQKLFILSVSVTDLNMLAKRNGKIIKNNELVPINVTLNDVFKTFSFV